MTTSILGTRAFTFSFWRHLNTWNAFRLAVSCVFRKFQARKRLELQSELESERTAFPCVLRHFNRCSYCRRCENWATVTVATSRRDVSDHQTVHRKMIPRPSTTASWQTNRHKTRLIKFQVRYHVMSVGVTTVNRTSGIRTWVQIPHGKGQILGENGRPIAKYRHFVHLWRRCGLMSNYIFTTYACTYAICDTDIHNIQYTVV